MTDYGNPSVLTALLRASDACLSAGDPAAVIEDAVARVPGVRMARVVARPLAPASAVELHYEIRATQHAVTALCVELSDTGGYAPYEPYIAHIARTLGVVLENRALALEASRAAQRSNALVEAMSDASPFGVLLVDNRTDAILYFNHRFCEIWGLTEHEDAMRRGDLTNGQIVPYCIPSLADPEAFARTCAPLQDESNRVVVDDEIPFTTGRTIRRYSTQIRGPNDAYYGRLYMFEDITARRLLEGRAALTDRLTSVGTLAAGIAHEINNPLTFVIGGIEAIEIEVAQLRSVVVGANLDARLGPLLQDARDGAERVHRIVHDMRAFARVDTQPGATSSLSDVLASAINLTRAELRGRAELRTEFASTPRVVGDASRLVQVFVNLLLNAAQAIQRDVGGANCATVSTSVAADGHVLVAVSDTGEGIDPEHVAHVFDPFFTTKPVGVGTGLGLSISHTIVRALGGSMWVESARGKGTTFFVSLVPGGQDVQAHVTERATPKAPRILVIDDEPAVGRLLSHALAAYDVHATTSGLTAMQRISSGERFDLVLCDVMMPQIGGVELYKQVGRMCPEQAARFVFMTGGTLDSPAVAAVKDLAVPLLLKPYSTKDVLENVKIWLSRDVRSSERAA